MEMIHMPRPIKTALIGCGSVSLIGILPQLVVPDARERIDLVAVCDVVAERAEATAAQFGVPDAYGDPEAVFARPDIELVLIITPIPFHYPLTMRALAAGKHVYVQKTMSTTYAEAEEMIAAARERGLTLIAAPGQMLAPAMQKMKALVDGGALGKVYWAWGSTGGWGHDYEPTRHGDDVMTRIDPSWYYKRGGGPQRDVTVYMLHSLTGVLGPARSVAAMSGRALPERTWRDKTIPVEVDDNTLLLLDWGDATFGMAGGHSCMTGQLLQWGSMGIYGSDGAIETLEIEPLSGHPTKLYLNSRHAIPELADTVDGVYAPPGWLPHVTPEHAAIPEPHVYADIIHCADCILGLSQPIASVEHAAHVVEIIEKGYIAAQTGQTQQLRSTF
jgi:predicted dehydrogenase